MATTGIATPLIVSCSTNDPNKPVDTDGNDKKYNITQATYDNLEKQLIFKYQHKKMAEGLLGDDLKDDMNNLSIQLNALRKESNKSKYNYTFRTNCLIELAARNYGIQISRGFSSSLDQDFENEKENYANAYRRYLQNNNFNPTDADNFTESFKKNFGKLKADILDQFSDPLYALTNLKANLLSCFDDATKELEYAHTQQLISDFSKTWAPNILLSASSSSTSSRSG